MSGRDAPAAPLNLLTQATGALKEAVGAKVKEFLDACAAEADKQQKLQPDCPFYHATNNRVMDGTINWSITDYPTVSIEPFGGRWVVAPLDGKARIKARQVDLFTGAVYRRSKRSRLQLHHPPGHRRRHRQAHPALLSLLSPADWPTPWPELAQLWGPAGATARFSALGPESQKAAVRDAGHGQQPL